MINHLRKTLIVAFCLWHVTALTAYSVTDAMSELNIFGFIRNTVYQKSRPYMFSMSLWQRWPLFAPDPLRRVIAYTFEAWTGDSWEVVGYIGPDDKSAFHSSSMLKLMRRLDENEHQGSLRERLAYRTCSQRGLLEGTKIRVIRSYHVIPRHARPQSISWWMQWEPHWQSNEVLSTTCPDTPVL
ncbi:MAG: hypothetical protein O2904_04390 [bacterium]|nr:hypothetical protein [bacterium]